MNDKFNCIPLLLCYFKGKFNEGNGKLLVFVFSPYRGKKQNKHPHYSIQLNIFNKRNFRFRFNIKSAFNLISNSPFTDYNIYSNYHDTSDTTISRRKCTNPSDLVSQATKSPVSTVVGDHTGILGVVFLHFLHSSSSRTIPLKFQTNPLRKVEVGRSKLKMRNEKEVK